MPEQLLLYSVREGALPPTPPDLNHWQDFNSNPDDSHHSRLLFETLMGLYTIKIGINCLEDLPFNDTTLKISCFFAALGIFILGAGLERHSERQLQNRGLLG